MNLWFVHGFGQGFLFLFVGKANSKLVLSSLVHNVGSVDSLLLAVCFQMKSVFFSHFVAKS